MKRLYLETNDLIGQIFQQDSGAATLISDCSEKGIEVCLPEISFQECVETVQKNDKALRDFKIRPEVKPEIFERTSPTMPSGSSRT